MLLLTANELSTHYPSSKKMLLTDAITYTCQVKPTWSPDAKGYKTAMTNIRHCLAIIGDKVVESITPDDLTKIQQVATKELGRANATANRWTAALTTVLTTLKKRGKLQGEVPFCELLPEPKGRLTFYTEQEVELMLNACDRVDDGALIYDAIKFAALTGCRQGEMLKLQWSDVFFEDQQLVFRDTKNKGEDRWLPITSLLMDHLQQMHGRRIDDHVFDINKDRLLRRLRKVQQIAGIKNAKDKCWHTLRHTAATRLFAKGAELPVAMEILGHSNAKTTLRYAHATQEGMRKALAQL